MSCSKTLTQSLALSILLLINMAMTPTVEALPTLQTPFAMQAHQLDDDHINDIYHQEQSLELAETRAQAERERREAQQLENLQTPVPQAQNRQTQNQQQAQTQSQSAQVLASAQQYTNLAPDIIASIDQEAQEKQVPLSIVLGLMEQESSFRTDAVNPQTGAIGLGQIEHPTAVELASQGGFAVGDLHDPKFNAKVAISYLETLYHETGDWNATLTAYNRGLGGLYAFQRQNGTSVSVYSQQVLQKAQHIREVTGAES